MKQACYIIIMIISILVSGVHAEEINWIHYGTNSNGEGFSYDSNNVKYTSEFIEVWTKVENHPDIQSLWLLCIVDKTFGLLVEVNMGKDHKVIYGCKEKWYPITSGSLMETLYQILIRKQEISKFEFPTPIPLYQALTNAIKY